MMRWWVAALCCLLCRGVVAVGYWQPHVSGTGRIGSYREGGALDVWVPITQSSNYVTFVEARGARLRHQWGAGGGAGFRRFLTPDCAIGLNGFADWNRSRYGVNRWQVGAGSELFGPCWHARINGYVPQQATTPVILDTRRALELVGNEIILTDIGEEGLDQGYLGVDAEVGYLPFCTRWVELWAFAGGYSFWANSAKTITGPKVRMEYRMEDLWGWCQARLTFGGEWQYDSVRGHQSAFVVTLRLPLGYKSASSRCCPCRSICRRMGDAVTREPSTVTYARNVGDVALNTEVLADAFFVWETAMAGAGTQEDPTSLPDAESRAGPNDILIFLQDQGDIQISALGTNSIIGQTRQQFRGYGDNARIDLFFPQAGTLTITPLPGRSGARAILDGVAGNDAFTLASGNRVDGLQVNDGANQIRGTNVNLATIHDMILRDATANGIFLDGTGVARITSSTITGAGIDGIHLEDAITPEISGNGTVEGAASGLLINATQATAISGTIRNNSFVGGTADAVSFTHTGGGTYTLAFDTNKMTSTMAVGGHFSNAGDCDLLQFTSFANNTVIGGGTATDGIVVERAHFVDADGGTTEIGTSAAQVNGRGLSLDQVRGTLTFSSLDIANSGGTGLFVRDCDGKSGAFALGTGTGTIDTAGGPAIDIDPVTLDCTFATVSSSASPTEAIKLDTVAGQLLIQNGTITGATGDTFSITGPASLTFTYSGTATNTSNALLFVDGLTGGTLTFDGTMTDTGAEGITVQNAACATSIANTTIDNPTQTAITLTSNSGSFTFEDGTIQNIMMHTGVLGINIGNFTFHNNTATSNTLNANNFIFINGFGNTLAFTNNMITTTTSLQDIVGLSTTDSVSHNTMITGNTVNATAENGIGILIDAPNSTVQMNDNTLEGMYNAGLIAALGGTNHTGTFEMNRNTVDITLPSNLPAIQFATATNTESSRLTGTMDQNMITVTDGIGIECCTLRSAATGSGVIADITVTNNMVDASTMGLGIAARFSPNGGNNSDALATLIESNACANCAGPAVILELGTAPGQSGMINTTIQNNTDPGAVGVGAYAIGGNQPNSTNVCGTLTNNTTMRLVGIDLAQSGAEVIRITDLSNLSSNNNGINVVQSGMITDIGSTTCPLP